jgi:hypothetical protein
MNRIVSFFILWSAIICTSCDTKEPENELTTRCPCFERDLPAIENRWKITGWEVAENGFVGIKGISFEKKLPTGLKLVEIMPK